MRLACLVFLVACMQPPVRVTVSQASFATTGSNLFNCTTPDFPPDRHALDLSPIDCTPDVEKDGTFSTTPVTVTRQIACGDGHGAMVTVTCAGMGGNNDVAGTAEISIGEGCDAKENTVNGQSFDFADLVPAANQSAPLQACALFDNLCGSSTPCAYNAFSATLTVENIYKK